MNNTGFIVRAHDKFCRRERVGDKMRKLILGKTLLESYQSIPRIIGSIDRLVVESSAHSYSLSLVRDDTMQKMQAVIDLIERKKRLMRIKLAVEDGIKACSKLDAKILVRYYFDRAHTLLISEELGMNRRNVHRKINVAIVNFVDKLNSIGYPSNKLKEIISSEEWIVGIYNHHVDKFIKKDSNLVYLQSLKATTLKKQVARAANFS